MFEFSGNAYLWIKAGHIICVVAWMAGLFYLPRLFVYHCQVEAGSETSELFKVMERRLLRAIMYPAMLASFFFGGLLLADSSTDWTAGWLHIKLLAVFVLLASHMMMARWRKDFEADANTKPEKFYRIANEVPTILMLIIVITAVLKPW